MPVKKKTVKKAAKQSPTPAVPHPSIETATFAAGCFWGVEETFRCQEGVIETSVGYTGGTAEDPTYEEVSTGSTGHAEAVQITFDPTRITYERLLDIFWQNHDSTQLDRQGPDVGTQYRSAVFYHTPAQKKAAEKSKAALEKSGRFSKPIATKIVAASTFYRGEEYHQRYLQKRGQNVCH